MIGRLTLPRLSRVCPRSGWLVTERFLADRQCALVEFLRLSVSALPPIKVCQIGEGLPGHVWVVCAFCVFGDRKGALVERLRLAVLTLVSKHIREVGERLAHIGVTRTERCFADDQ